MKATELEKAYFFNAAFFARVPHGDKLTRLSFEMLLTIKLFGEMSADNIYKKMGEYYRQRYEPPLREGIEYLATNNYLSKKGAKYYLTDKSLLLIAQVERKLKGLAVKWTEGNPVGRPVKGKD